jgi:hypothetical protein
VDPVDFTSHLQPGKNVIGVEVCYFGMGDGTWPMGGPGFIARLDVEHADGRREQIISDESWLTFLDRAHRPGQYKRWFLRALAGRVRRAIASHGWDFRTSRRMRDGFPRRILAGASNLPSIFAGGENMFSAPIFRRRTRTRRSATVRTCASATSADARDDRAREATHRIGSREMAARSLDWFESRTPGSFEIDDAPVARQISDTSWELPSSPTASDASFATFEFTEHVVGWPRFTIDAPAGTIIELMTIESHDPVKRSAVAGAIHPSLDALHLQRRRERV